MAYEVERSVTFKDGEGRKAFVFTLTPDGVKGYSYGMTKRVVPLDHFIDGLRLLTGGVVDRVPSGAAEPETAREAPDAT